MGADDKIRVDCSNCGKSLSVGASRAGQRGKCPGCGESIQVPAAPGAPTPPTEQPVARAVVRAAPVVESVPEFGRARDDPPPRSRRRDRRRSRRDDDDREEPGDHQLTRLATIWVILLNAVTIGLFSTIWFNLMHGRMPKLRRDDPSAGKAIGFLFIPFFNLYWFFFTYLRLVTRINEQREMRRLPHSNLHALFVAFCVIHLVSSIILSLSMPGGVWVNPVSMVLGCIVFSVIQCRVNELVDASELTEARLKDKACPDCDERVKIAAKVCRYCDYEFDEPKVDPVEQEEADAALDVELERVVLRNRRALMLSWGWLTTGLGLAWLALTTPYVLGLGLAPPHPESSPPGLLERILGAMFFTVPFLTAGAICLFRAKNYGNKLRAVEEPAEAEKRQ